MRMPKDPPKVDEMATQEGFLTDLGNYLRRDDVKEFITHANELHLYWDEVLYRPKPQNTHYNILWAAIKTIRKFRQKEIKISDHDGFKFMYSLNDQMSQKLHEFDMNLGGSLTGESIISDEDRDKYLISSLMEEAIASSQIEGAATTRKIAKDMLRKGRKPINRSERMIVNNYRSIKMIMEYKNEDLTPQLLLDIQASMTRDTLENQDDEGRFRYTNDVFVMDKSTGQVHYKPPDYDHILTLIDDLCSFANDKENEEFIHPIIKASLLHFLIGYIHPFVDGNGRTARAIFYWYLIRNKYWLIEFMPISRTIINAPSQYAKAYLHTEKDDNDFTYFLGYMLKAIDQAMKDLKLFLKRQTEKKKVGKIDQLIRLKSINLRQVHILEMFIKKPNKEMMIKEAVITFDVVYQTARTDLLGLAALGYLETIVGKRRKLIFRRSFNFEEIIGQGC